MIVAAAAVGSIDRLEPLARRIFGDGDRPAGWFRRKLERECVDPSLSRVLHRDDARADDPRGWLGYALVGTPPSLPGIARTAGIGLVPDARGRGLGRALVEALVEVARAAACTRVCIPAEASTAPFYARLGFREHRRVQTLLHFGCGANTQLDPPTAWDERDDGIVVNAWLREAWERTDPALRGTAHVGGSTFLLAREGIAIACHRSIVDRGCTPSDAAASFDALRNRVRDGTPLIVVHGDAVSPITPMLHDRGWVAVQHGVSMTIDLDRVDKRSTAVDDGDASSTRGV